MQKNWTQIIPMMQSIFEKKFPQIVLLFLFLPHKRSGKYFSLPLNELAGIRTHIIRVFKDALQTELPTMLPGTQTSISQLEGRFFGST